MPIKRQAYMVYEGHDWGVHGTRQLIGCARADWKQLA